MSTFKNNGTLLKKDKVKDNEYPLFKPKYMRQKTFDPLRHELLQAIAMVER